MGFLQNDFTWKHEKFLVFDTSKDALGYLRSIGYLIIENGKIVKEYYSLIHFEEEWRVEAKSILMTEFWEICKTDFENAEYFVTFIAANLTDTLSRSVERIGGIWNKKKPNIQIVDIAQKVFPKLVGYSREHIIRQLNIFIAGNDDNIDMNEALLSFEMYKSILSIADFDSGKELIEAYKEKKDFFESNFFRGNVGTNEFNDIVFENEDFDPKGFHFVLTGNFKKDPTKKKLEAGLTEKGLFLEKSLNNKVNLIGVGSNAGPNKIAKIRDGEGRIKAVNEEWIYNFLNI
jgi:hypothetical protein